MGGGSCRKIRGGACLGAAGAFSSDTSKKGGSSLDYGCSGGHGCNPVWCKKDSSQQVARGAAATRAPQTRAWLAKTSCLVVARATTPGANSTGLPTHVPKPALASAHNERALRPPRPGPCLSPSPSPSPSPSVPLSLSRSPPDSFAHTRAETPRLHCGAFAWRT